MVSGITGLLAVATLIANQAVFKDPGPPPAEARAVPTLEQAKSFVETMANRHGSYACSDQYGQVREAIKVKFTNSDINITSRLVHDMTKDGEGPFVSEELSRQDLDIGDVGPVTVIQLPAGDGCHPVYFVKLQCRDGNCVTRTDDTKDLRLDTTKTNSKVLHHASGGFSVKEKEMAERIVKALNFYREQIKAVTPESPF